MGHSFTYRTDLKKKLFREIYQIKLLIKLGKRLNSLVHRIHYQCQGG